MADRSFAGQLSRESEAWVAEGIVSAEQAAAIRGRYADAREERRGSATTALAVIGAITLGVGVIGFVAANWDGMSHGVRLALLTVVVGGSYAAGFPPARPHRQPPARRRGAVPGRRAPLRRVALPGRADVPRRGARPIRASALGRRSRRRQRSSSARARSRPPPSSSSRAGSGMSSDSRSTTRAAIPGPRSPSSRSSTAARSMPCARPDRRDTVRRSGFPRGGPRRRAARRGGGALRLHLRRRDRRARFARATR